MTAERRVPRIVDVARLAGVSVGTASKALNGRRGASAETRERVRAAAAELGFRPNALARGLPSGRSFTVGLITTDSFGRFTIPIMLAAEDALGADDLALLMCDTRDDADREDRYVQMLAARAVDGIIVTGRRTEPRAPLARDPGCPVVYAFTPSRDPRDCSIVVDEAGGTAIAVEHLLSLGRRRLAVVSGPRSHRAARIRADAAESAITRADASLVAPPAFGAWSEGWGRDAAAALLGSVTDLDGIVCASDQIARGVTDVLRDRGRRIPGDVAVTGFDDWDVMALGARPPLTSIDMRLSELGRSAARMLLAAMSGRPSPGAHLSPCRLITRESAPSPLPEGS